MFKLTDGLLIAAVAVGIVTALTGLVEVGHPPLPDTTAARVNDVPISADELQSLLQRRTQEGAPVEQLLGTLDDMIDEELLIQRASELGILRRDSSVRVAIIQAMEKSILNEERGRRYSDTQLQAFFHENPALFSEPRRMRLEEIVIRDAGSVASSLAALGDTGSAEVVAAGNENVSLIRLPSVPLSLNALARRYPKDVIVQLKTAVEDDVVSYQASRGMHLVKVLEVLAASLPPFDEARLSVLNELQIHRQDAAYDEYLAWLRQRADIRKNERVAR